MESVITECPYICAPNIMDTPDFSTKMVQLDMSGGSCIKAGTPISADGKVANDETAIGILLNDCHACLGNARGLVVIGGRIKQDVAKNHSGITISDKAKAAMINVTFTGDGARAGGGGGGGAEPETITWDGETSGLVSADVNGHLYYKVSDYVPKIKDLIGGTVSCSDGGKKVIAADDVTYVFVSDDGFSVDTSNIDLKFFVVYKDNAVINAFDFPQKGVYFEKGTAFVSALSFTVTNDSNVTVEINVTADGEAGALTATVVTPMCLIKEAAGRGFFINATMQTGGMNLLSFSAAAPADAEFNALFAFYTGAGLSIYVYAVKCSYQGACSISGYTLAMTAIG